MPVLLPPSPFDAADADRRRHPAIYREAPSSAVSVANRLTDLAFIEALKGASGTLYFQLEQTYNARLDELSRLRNIERGWDSYGAPAPHDNAIESAAQLLVNLRELHAKPDAVRPSNEGGVGVCFTEGAKYAHIEFSNSGEAFALMFGPADEPEVWELSETTDISATWTRIRAYLQS